MTSLTRAVFSSTAAQVFAKVTTAILAIVTTKILTNYFGPADYGRYGTVTEFLAFFAILADFGLFTYALRELSRIPSDERSEFFRDVLWSRTALSIITMLMAMALAFALHQNVPAYQDPKVLWGIVLSTGMVVATMLAGTFSILLQLEYRMIPVALGQILGKVVSVVMIMTIVWAVFPANPETGFMPILFAGVSGAVVTCIYIYQAAKRCIPIVWRDGSASRIKSVLIAAYPYALMVALIEIYLRVDLLLLTFLLPGVEASGDCLHQYCAELETGRYLVAARIMEVLLIIPVFFMNSMLPQLTKAIESSDQSRLQRLSHETWRALLVLGSGAMLVVAPFGVWLTEITAQPSFLSSAAHSGSDQALWYLGLMLPLSYVSFGASYILIAMGRQRVLVALALLAVVVNVGGNMVMIPQAGLVGAAQVSLAAEVVFVSTKILALALLMPQLLRSLVSLSWRVLPLAALLVVAGLSTSALELSPLLAYVLTGGILGVAYLALLVPLRIISLDEIRTLLSLRRH